MEEAIPYGPSALTFEQIEDWRCRYRELVLKGASSARTIDDIGALAPDPFAAAHFEGIKEGGQEAALLVDALIRQLGGLPLMQPPEDWRWDQPSLKPPAVPVIGPPTIFAKIGEVLFPDGTVVRELQNGEPLGRFALAEALRRAKPGDVVELSGPMERVTIGGAFPGKPHEVPTLRDVAVIGKVGTSPSIANLTLGGLGTWDDLTFADCDIHSRTKDSGAAAVTVMQNSIGGTLTFVRVHLGPDEPHSSAYNGKGIKWGIRAHGLSALNCYDVDVDPCDEHSIYADNLQGPCYFVRVRGGGNGGTGIQIVNRGQSGPAGTGPIAHYDCVFAGNDGTTRQGSDYTCAGHAGDVYYVGCRSVGSKTGGLVVWTDGSAKHRTWIADAGGNLRNLPTADREGFYGTQRVKILGCHFESPHSDREAIAVTGAREVLIDGTLIDWTPGNREVWFNTPHGGPIQNGKQEWRPLS